MSQEIIDMMTERILRGTTGLFERNSVDQIKANVAKVFEGAEWRYSLGPDGACGEKDADDTHRRICLAPEEIKPKDDLVERLRHMAKMHYSQGSFEEKALLEAADRLSKGCEK